MSVPSVILKSGIAAGTLTLAAGFAAYEALLNMDVAQKLSGLFSSGNEERTDENLSEEEKKIKECSDRYIEKWSKWYEKLPYEDMFLKGRDGSRRHAQIFMNEKDSGNWAIILHGFTSAPAGMAEFAYVYSLMGFNCILPSMIGHGNDPHTHCSMGWRDRLMVLDFIDYIKTLNPDAKIIIHGVSMGGATTMLTTGEKLPSNVKAAVADCGYTSVYDQYYTVAKNKKMDYVLPLMGVTSFISEKSGNFSFRKCSPLEAVKHSETPTLFVHGEADKFIPPAMMETLYEACTAPKDKFTVKGAGHAESSWYNPDLYWNRVYDFIKDKFGL